ncbi:MAG: response regulator [Desulfobacterales bacterium]|nr:response regulator [Desulfobacterales bacterium]
MDLNRLLNRGFKLSRLHTFILSISGIGLTVVYRMVLKFLHFPPSLNGVVTWAILLIIPFTNRTVVFSLLIFKCLDSFHSILSRPQVQINGIVTNIINLTVSILLTELFFRVINGLRANNLRLEQETKRAEEANNAKDIFLASMSHEIRTPLSGIMGVSDMLLDNDELSMPVKNHLNLIRYSSETLHHIVNNILDYSCLEAGKEQVEHSSFYIKPLINQLIKSFEVTIKDKPIKLYLECGKNVPSIIISDATKIQQICSNLLSNSIKYSKSGSITLTISAASDNKKLRFDVNDNGIGIAEDKLEFVFAEFERIHNIDDKKIEGTGLGLTISKKLVQLLNGTISVKSTLGKGSTFSFEIPVEKVDFIDDKDWTQNEEKLSQISGGNILLAEDNSVNQLYIRHFLEKQGYNIITVEDGEAAVNAYRNGCFNLVLMDIQMPKKTGVEATKEIREYEATQSLNKTPIFAITASVTKPEQQYYLKSGIDVVCAKPVDMKFLIRNIKQVIPN